MNVDTMNEKIQELRELKRMQEDLAAEIASIEEELKGHMSACGMDTLLGMDWRITWKAVTSKRLDTGALRKAMPDVAQAFTRETTTKRFVLA
jgi:predicted phage-related endonuclease